MDADDKLTYPEPDDRDDLQTAVKSGLNMVPFLGGPLAELVDLVIEPSIDRRQREWGHTVSEMVVDVKERVHGLEELVGNEEWISALAHASRVASGTHLDEKREMLRRILTKLAVDPGESKPAATLLADRFIRFVDEFDPTHFLALGFAADPLGVTRASGEDPNEVINAHHQEAMENGDGALSQATCRGFLLSHFLSNLDVLDDLSANMAYNELVTSSLVSPNIHAGEDVLSGFGQQDFDVKPWATGLGIALLEWIAKS